MYTRCPACQAVYELRANLLAEASGVVRCGNCGKTFNSLSELYENHPDEADSPLRGQGMPPMLEHPDMVQAELPVGHFEEEPPSESVPGDWLSPEDAAPESAGRHMLWPAASAALFVLLLVQFWVLWQTPGSVIDRWAGGSDAPVGYLDPNQVIQIVSRDLHAHPSLDDAVVISASLRNQAESTVPFPVIEVRFFDASQQVLGVRRVTPEEYLDDPDRIERGLASGLVMPLLMEFVVGTNQPAGFQMRFH